jgi:hypothetical protein
MGKVQDGHRLVVEIEFSSQGIKKVAKDLVEIFNGKYVSGINVFSSAESFDFSREAGERVSPARIRSGRIDRKSENILNRWVLG